MMKLAVDAMGGDHAPEAIVEGCLEALRASGELFVTLVGQIERIEPLLSQADDVRARIALLDAREVIENTEPPVLAIRKKKDSSLVRAAELVRAGEAQALVSAGSTGAVLSCGIFRIGRLPGVERPALATLLPTVSGSPVLVADVGANVDCRPEWLLQFAQMGEIYMCRVIGVDRPRVALINIGEEAEKGNQLTKETAPLLENSGLCYVGNAEARALPMGACDVAVCDGFMGNLVLKSMEGITKAVFAILKEELTSTLRAKIGAALLKPRLRAIKRRLDPDEVGGAPMLGVAGAVVKAHGSSRAHAFCRAVQQAQRMLEKDVVSLIRERVAP